MTVVAMTEREARLAICETARDIWVRGLGAAADGNLSVRIDRERLITTPSGCHKGYLKPSDLVLCDVDGKALRGGKPSSELGLHVEAYRRRPDIGAVIHAHPPMATAYNLAGGHLSDVFVSESIFSYGQVASAPYTTPTTADVPAVLGEYFACYDAVMMARHGSVTLGATLRQAFARLDAMEHSARIGVMCKLLGGAAPLPDAEVDHLYDVANAGTPPRYREPGATCPPLESNDAGDALLVAEVMRALVDSGSR